jgi:hypothetical protein
MNKFDRAQEAWDNMCPEDDDEWTEYDRELEAEARYESIMEDRYDR